MDIYAYKNTPEVIEKSSSGGAFSKIANIFSDQYKDNYSIYGAAWTENNEIKHIRITQLADLKQFNGSKYARSNIANIFIQVENDLQNGMSDTALSKTTFSFIVPSKIGASCDK